MLICRSPFRISYFGGGTDFPEWHIGQGDGLVISTTINKYCNVLLRNLPPFFSFKHRLRYFETETVKNINEIKHSSIKAILKEYYNEKKGGLEIIHYADLPALSGLGASSAFTNCLIYLIHKHKNLEISKKKLAEKSIYIERKILKQHCGYQDQYATSYGGFNEISFKKKRVFLSPINFQFKKKEILEKNTLIFFTGIARKAELIEKEKIKTLKKNKNYYNEIYQIALEAKKLFTNKMEQNFLENISELLNESWKLKKKLSDNVSNNYINDLYISALKNGALGGKILGAGGGGFIMFLTKNSSDRKKLIEFLHKFINVKFKFENEGTKLMNFRNYVKK